MAGGAATEVTLLGNAFEEALQAGEPLDAVEPIEDAPEEVKPSEASPTEEMAQEIPPTTPESVSKQPSDIPPTEADVIVPADEMPTTQATDAPVTASVAPVETVVPEEKPEPEKIEKPEPKKEPVKKKKSHARRPARAANRRKRRSKARRTAQRTPPSARLRARSAAPPLRKLAMPLLTTIRARCGASSVGQGVIRPKPSARVYAALLMCASPLRPMAVWRASAWRKAPARRSSTKRLSMPCAAPLPSRRSRPEPDATVGSSPFRLNSNAKSAHAREEREFTAARLAAGEWHRTLAKKVRKKYELKTHVYTLL